MWNFHTRLTRAQFEMLTELSMKPQRYNGLREKPVKRLAELGLVEYEIDLRIGGLGRSQLFFDTKATPLGEIIGQNGTWTHRGVVFSRSAESVVKDVMQRQTA